MSWTIAITVDKKRWYINRRIVNGPNSPETTDNMNQAILFHNEKDAKEFFKEWNIPPSFQTIFVVAALPKEIKRNSKTSGKSETSILSLPNCLQ